MFNRLPLRAKNVICEYSIPSTRSNLINSNYNSNFDSNFDLNSDSEEIDEMQNHSFPITILIIVFNIIICVNMLYIMCVVIGSIVCMYNSHV